MGYIGQDEDHLESPGTPSCDSLQTSNPMQSSAPTLLESLAAEDRGLRDLPDEIKRLQKPLDGLTAHMATIAANGGIPSAGAVGDRMKRMPRRVSETHRRPRMRDDLAAARRDRGPSGWCCQTGPLHHCRKSMDSKGLRSHAWVSASNCAVRSYGHFVAPGDVSPWLQTTYIDQEKQRKSCYHKDLRLYC